MTHDVTDRARLAEALRAALTDLTCDPILTVALLRMLAQGRPIALSALAVALGCSEAEATQRLQGCSNVEWDADGRIIAAVGLSQRPTAHRFTLAGRDLYTWCALDTLMYPAVLGKRAQIASQCPVTGEMVMVTVGPTQVEAVTPSTAVVSLVVPDLAAACYDIRSAFCNAANFFATLQAGQHWSAAHSQPIVLVSVADAFWIGHQVMQRLIQQ